MEFLTSYEIGVWVGIFYFGLLLTAVKIDNSLSVWLIIAVSASGALYTTIIEPEEHIVIFLMLFFLLITSKLVIAYKILEIINGELFAMKSNKPPIGFINGKFLIDQPVKDLVIGGTIEAHIHIRDNGHCVEVISDSDDDDEISCAINNGTMMLIKPSNQAVKSGCGSTNITIKNCVVSADICGGVSIKSASRSVVNIYLPFAPALKAKGAVSVRIEAINQEEWAVKGTGASTVVVSGGSLRHLSVKASGATSIDTSLCQSVDVSAEASGTSDLRVYSSGSVQIHAGGASSVKVLGNPPCVKGLGIGSASVNFH